MSTLNAASQAPETLITTLSATKLHEIALDAFRIGNRGRLSLCEALRVLADTRLYHELGHPSVTAYGAAYFQLRRSETLEAVRVARALTSLAEIREAYAAGDLGWSVVKAITRIATESTERSWLAFATEHTVLETLAEVRDAKRNGREQPNDNRYGLPNLDERMVLRFRRSDLEKVRGAFAVVAKEIVERSGAEETTPEDVLLTICERLLEKGLDETAGGSGKSPTKYSVLYHTCPDCRRSGMHTSNGLVEVDREEIDRVEGDADVVGRDRPTPPALRRRILLRDGDRCANPRCDHRADHCHHITFLSNGGRTVLANEVAVCATCHALIHAGLLTVKGTPGEDIRWTAKGDPLTAGLRDAKRRADRLPVLKLESAYADARDDSSSSSDGRGSGNGKSAYADSSRSRSDLDLGLLATALTHHGKSKKRSIELVRHAYDTLQPHERTEANILRHAFRNW